MAQAGASGSSLGKNKLERVQSGASGTSLGMNKLGRVVYLFIPSEVLRRGEC
jgi:hypothetical protein